MSKPTLLDLTQEILSALSSDEVNSISDTTESMQVANIIKRKYLDIVPRGQLEEHFELFKLDPSGDITSPTLMYVPDGFSSIKWIKYFNSNINETTQLGFVGNTDLTGQPSWSLVSSTSNTVGTGTKTFTVASGISVLVGQSVVIQNGLNFMYGTLTSYVTTTMVIEVTSYTGSGTATDWRIMSSDGADAPPGYQYVTILPIQQFIEIINDLNPREDNVGSFTFTDDSANFTFYYKNDNQPTFCSILSNHFVIFDSYDNTQDTTLQDSKSMCYGKSIPTFSLTDSFTIDLDEEQFPLLINEAKALAFFELKQQPHPLATQEAKRQWSTVSKNKSIAGKPSSFAALPDFGRRGPSNFGPKF